MSQKKILSAGIGYSLGNILIKGIAFITLPIFSRLLSTEQFGIYSTYMAYENVLAIIVGLGLYASIKNAKYEFAGEVNTYVSTVIWLTTIPTLFFLLVSIVWGGWFSDILKIDSPLVVLLVLQSFGSAMLSISNVKLSLNYNYMTYMKFAAFNTITNVLLSVFLIVFVFNTNREYGRIIGSAIPLLCIGVFVFIREGIKGEFKFDSSMAKFALMMGIPLIWHYLSQQIQNQFDRIAITNLVNLSKTGIYSFAHNISNILQIIFYSIENVWVIWMYEQMNTKNYTAIKEKSNQYLKFISYIAILMIIGSREVIMVMGDKDYWEGVYVCIPLIIGAYIVYLYTLPSNTEYFFKKTKYIAIMTGIAAITNISLNYLFIPFFGYIAAAYTTIASYSVQFLGHWLVYKKLLRENDVNELFCLKQMLNSLFTVVIAGVVSLSMVNYPIIRYLLGLCYFTFAITKNQWIIQYAKDLLKHKKK